MENNISIFSDSFNGDMVNQLQPGQSCEPELDDGKMFYPDESREFYQKAFCKDTVEWDLESEDEDDDDIKYDVMNENEVIRESEVKKEESEKNVSIFTQKQGKNEMKEEKEEKKKSKNENVENEKEREKSLLFEEKEPFLTDSIIFKEAEKEDNKLKEKTENKEEESEGFDKKNEYSFKSQNSKEFLDEISKIKKLSTQYIKEKFNLERNLLLKELEEKEDKIKWFESEIKKLKCKEKEKNKILDTKEKKISDLVEELKSLKKDGLNKLMKKNQNDLSKKTEDINLLKQNILETERRITEIRMENHSLRVEINNNNLINDELINKNVMIDNLKSKIKSLMEKEKNYKDIIEKQKDGLVKNEILVFEKNKTLEDLETEMETIRTDNREMKNQIRNFSNQEKLFRKKFLDLKIEKEKHLKNICENLLKQKNEEVEKNFELHKKLNESIEYNQELSQENQRLKEIIEKKDDPLIYKKKNKSLIEILKVKEMKIEALEEYKSNAQSKFENLLAFIKRAKEKIPD